MNELYITSLHTYPVKSCAGVELSTAEITPRGLIHDRDFMLVDDTGNYLSQRQIPQMALVVPRIGETAITLSSPGVEEIEVPLEIEQDDERLIQANVHGKPVYGQVVSDDLNEWFNTALPAYKDNEGFKLVRVREDLPRYIYGSYHGLDTSNQVGFADGYAILLTSEASLERLNGEMDEPVPMDRFRPNIVVGGEDLEPYDEDYWIGIDIGQLAAQVVKGCDRCQIPDVNQATAQVGKAVRVALKTRRGKNRYDKNNGGVFFGQNLNHVYVPGVSVSVGDPVIVYDRAEKPNIIFPSTI